jgi:Helix-turn-helix domain
VHNFSATGRAVKTFGGLIREKNMADKIGVSVRTLRNWRDQKIIPFIKVKKVILFDEQEILQILSRNFRRGAK